MIERSLGERVNIAGMIANPRNEMDMQSAPTLKLDAKGIGVAAVKPSSTIEEIIQNFSKDMIEMHSQ